MCAYTWYTRHNLSGIAAHFTNQFPPIAPQFLEWGAKLQLSNYCFSYNSTIIAPKMCNCSILHLKISKVNCYMIHHGHRTPWEGQIYQQMTQKLLCQNKDRDGMIIRKLYLFIALIAHTGMVHIHLILLISGCIFIFTYFADTLKLWT